MTDVDSETSISLITSKKVLVVKIENLSGPKTETNICAFNVFIKNVQKSDYI